MTVETAAERVPLWEIVARAMCRANSPELGEDDPCTTESVPRWTLWEYEAKAALEALAAEFAKDGRKVVGREDFRRAFDAGCTQGVDEAVAEDWGSRPGQTRQKAFEDLFAEWNDEKPVCALQAATCQLQQGEDDG